MKSKTPKKNWKKPELKPIRLGCENTAYAVNK
jgi:hypothetical protein